MARLSKMPAGKVASWLSRNNSPSSYARRQGPQLVIVQVQFFQPSQVVEVAELEGGDAFVV